MARKSPTLRKMTSLFEDEINRHSRRIEELKRMYRQLEEAVALQYPNLTEESLMDQRIINSNRVQDAIQAYVIVNRIGDIMMDFKTYFSYENKDLPRNADLEFGILDEAGGIPNEDFSLEFKEKVRKLLAVYDISPASVKDYHEADAYKKPNETQFIELDHKDLLSLGSLFYGGAKYETALGYFCHSMEKALQRDLGDEFSNDSYYDDDYYGYQEYLMSLLDQAAFAAYQCDHVQVAHDLTELLLQFSPNDERLEENINFYQEELKIDKKLERRVMNQENEPMTQIIRLALEEAKGILCYRNWGESIDRKLNLSDEKYSDKSQDPDTYQMEDDEIVKFLCQNSDKFMGTKPTEDRLKCFTIPSKGMHIMEMPEMKVEIISQDPFIVRVYDILTSEESMRIQHLAEPKLHRSTVQTSKGTSPSKFREANTAWLPTSLDKSIRRLELRIEAVSNLSLEGSEDMQVVNYDIGGFYGPHLDATGRGYFVREDNQTTGEESSPVIVADRVATILIYLNDVERGGATVFPRLSLSVKPIARSALIWFNLNKDGSPDARTLHTGCPILVGTKWIATKWPKDQANMFIRPCGLKEYY